MRNKESAEGKDENQQYNHIRIVLDAMMIEPMNKTVKEYQRIVGHKEDHTVFAYEIDERNASLRQQHQQTGYSTKGKCDIYARSPRLIHPFVQTHVVLSMIVSVAINEEGKQDDGDDEHPRTRQFLLEQMPYLSQEKAIKPHENIVQT